jgi:hypothetical protein
LNREVARSVAGIATKAFNRQIYGVQWNKLALLPQRHSYEPSGCREATKLRTRCLMRVDIELNGDPS